MHHHIHYQKIIILVVCFIMTSVLIYRTPTSIAIKKKVPLTQALSDIKGWTREKPVPLDPKIVEGLDLDDYINQSYVNGHESVSLYVGYYLTSKKVGAAHSPLVCFPGQGWLISTKEKKAINLNGNTLNLMSMIATRGQTRELVLYWFQAPNKTSPGTFLQKVNTLWAKLLHSREDNAFVRVSVPVEGHSTQKAFSTGIEFIEAFYPAFLIYVRGSA